MPVKLEDLSKEALILLIRQSWPFRVGQREMTEAIIAELSKKGEVIFERHQALFTEIEKALNDKKMSKYHKLHSEREKLWTQWERIQNRIDRLFESLHKLVIEGR